MKLSRLPVIFGIPRLATSCIYPQTLRTKARDALAMSWMCSSDTNAGLVENLYKNGLIEDARIKDAFLKASLTMLTKEK